MVSLALTHEFNVARPPGVRVVLAVVESVVDVQAVAVAVELDADEARVLVAAAQPVEVAAREERAAVV